MATDVSLLVDDYASLQAAVADWLNRADLNRQIPQFIQLAESGFRKKAQIMRRAYRRSVAQLTTNTIPQPDDYGSLDYIKNTDAATDQDASLEFVTSEMLEFYRPNVIGLGAPRYYTISGAVFEFIPAPSTPINLEIGYWRGVQSLSDANPTNWLLDDSPELYLWGALLMASPFLKNDQRIPTWQTYYAQALEDIRLDTERSQYSGAPLKMRTRRSF